MKKCWLILLSALLLSGCGAQETFETISDVYGVDASAVSYEVQLSLPAEAASPSMEADDGSKIYLCDGYTVTVQMMEAGDLNRTLRELSGFSKEELTVMKTMTQGITRYETTWCAAGEGEDQICRCVILDDGRCHYGVTVMANYTAAGELQTVWQDILNSVTLVNID